MGRTERRVARMLAAHLLSQVPSVPADLAGALGLLWSHPQVLTEAAELAEVAGAGADHLLGVTPLPDIPVLVHAHYTRTEVLAAVGAGEKVLTPSWREGVYNAEAAGADLLAFRLD